MNPSLFKITHCLGNFNKPETIAYSTVKNPRYCTFQNIQNTTLKINFF